VRDKECGIGGKRDSVFPSLFGGEKEGPFLTRPVSRGEGTGPSKRREESGHSVFLPMKPVKGGKGPPIQKRGKENNVAFIAGWQRGPRKWSSTSHEGERGVLNVLSVPYQDVGRENEDGSFLLEEKKRSRYILLARAR